MATITRHIIVFAKAAQGRATEEIERAHLDALAADGWRLISVCPIPNSPHHVNYYMSKEFDSSVARDDIDLPGRAGMVDSVTDDRGILKLPRSKA